MLKYFRVGIPFLVVVLSIINGINAIGSDNMPAFYANVTALFGWLAISYDEYITFRLNKGI